MNELLTQWKENQEAINELLAAQKELEAQIKPFVLENKATLNAEGVTASYKKGRASCDYAGAANAAGVDSKIAASFYTLQIVATFYEKCPVCNGEVTLRYLS